MVYFIYMSITIDEIILVTVLAHLAMFVYKWGRLNQAVSTLKKIGQKHGQYDGRTSAIQGISLDEERRSSVESHSTLKLTDKGVTLLVTSGRINI